MKIFLSGTESNDQQGAMGEVLARKTPPVDLPDASKPLMWNLMSYYYLRSGKLARWSETVRDSSRMVLIDSGAHSFQKGVHVDWESYTRAYGEWIRTYDRPNVLGYFEMDVDNVLGYERVKRLRRILEEESGVRDKIIPVWHKNRGIAEFKRMCAERAGLVIAITGFKNEDIRDEQYPMFLKEGWKHGCKVHCLGMTRKRVLDSVPFDFVDSSSWVQQAIHGRVGGRVVSKAQSRRDRHPVFTASYIEAMRDQLRYWRKWRRVNHDPF